MEASDIKKIREMFLHNDFSLIQQGLLLWDVLGYDYAMNQKIFQAVFGVADISRFINFNKMHTLWRNIGGVYYSREISSYLALWTLGKLSQYSELEEYFSTFTVLKITDISYSRTSKTSLKFPDNFTGFESLKILHLCKCGLKEVPDWVCELPNVTELNLSENNLSALPESLENLSQLTILRLNDNPLKSLPKNIWKKVPIRILEINDTLIHELPQECTESQTLQKLKMQRMGKVKLPEWTTTPSSLLSLFCEDVVLDTLPSSLKYLEVEHCPQKQNQKYLPTNLTTLKIGKASYQLRQNLWKVGFWRAGKTNVIRFNYLDLSSFPHLESLSIHKISHLVIDNFDTLSNIQNIEIKHVFLQEKIPEFDPQSWSQINTVIIDDACSSFLPKQFGFHPQLKMLSLDRINTSRAIENIEDIISPLKAPNLRKLQLRHNGIKQLPKKTLECPSLQILNVSHNKIENITSSIGKCRILRYLDLSNNLITSLSDELWNCQQLQSIRLQNNQLSKLSDHVCSLSNLSYLDIGRNQLRYLPSDIFRALFKKDGDPSLARKGFYQSVFKNGIGALYFYGNPLCELPPSIGTLEGLSCFELSSFPLKTLPKELGLLKVKKINCNGMKLGTIPDVIFQIKSLKVLHFRKNMLQSISEDIGKLDNLEILNLMENNLQTLPDSIVKLNNLKRLYIRGNALSAEEKQRISRLLPHTNISY